MAITFVQHATPGVVNNTAVNPVVVATSNFGSSVTSGNLSVVCTGNLTTGLPLSITSVADTLGTSYSIATGSDTGSVSAKPRNFIYFGKLTSSGTNKVTVTFANAGTLSTWCFADATEFSGQSASPLDVVSIGTGTTGAGSISTASMNTTGAGVIVCGATNDSIGAYTVGSGFTLLASGAGNGGLGGSEYEIMGSSSAGFVSSLTLVAGASWGISAASFLASGGVVRKPGLLLLGAGYLALKRDFGPIRTLLRGLLGR